MSKHNAQEMNNQDVAPQGADTPVAPGAEPQMGISDDANPAMSASGAMPKGPGPQATPEKHPTDKNAVEKAKNEEITQLKAKVEGLEAELVALKDQYLRKAADFENYRKRMVREKQDAIDFANQSLLLDLIPVIDDFERAIKSSETTDDKAVFIDGIKMIERRLVSDLDAKWGLKRFESAGTAFDPNRHEALMVEKTANVAEPTVKEDFVKGYSLKERIVRTAKVSVQMPLEEGGPAREGASGAEEKTTRA